MTAGAASPQRRILVVEDDGDLREVLCEVLSAEGWPCQTAANGAVALEIMRGGPPPALVLLDLMMPVVDGWQVRAQMKADPVLCAIPVVLMSASKNVGELAPGTDDLLRKPISTGALVDVIRKRLA